MVGGDMPGWLPSLFRRAGSTALTDRRGECVYAGCPHYRKCFIERSARASAEAEIVIANHALVMVNAARGRDPALAPTRIVFDEGHHLFDAANSTFAAALTGQETIELRRWLIGPEGKARGRRRGLAARLTDVASYDEAGAAALEMAIQAAGLLPGDGWLQRIGEGLAFGPIEKLLAAVRGTRLRPRHRPGCRLRNRDRDGRAGRRHRRRGGAGGRGAGSVAPPADCARKAAGGGARGRARLARFAGAGPDRGRDRRPGLAGSDDRRPGSRSRRGSAGRPIRISSTGSRSTGSTDASSTSAFTAVGSIRPGRSPSPCSSPRIMSSSPPRLCAAPRTGRSPRRGPERPMFRAEPRGSVRTARSTMPRTARC